MRHTGIGLAVLFVGLATASCGETQEQRGSGGSISAGGSVPSGGKPSGGSGGAQAVGGSAAGGSLPGGGSMSTGGSTSAGGSEALSSGGGDPCPENIPLDTNFTQKTHVTVSLELGGKPLIFGEPNALSQGGSITPTNFRFYLSGLSFDTGPYGLDDTAEAFPAIAVDASGLPLPYGVRLVNADEPSSLSFDLMSPPGQYRRLLFTLGLGATCNDSSFERKAPLDDASQLKWPPALQAGFLFLRFEGRSADVPEPGFPSLIHMGTSDGKGGGAPNFELKLPDGSPDMLTLHVALDAILEGASAQADLTGVPILGGAEVIAGEQLRRAALAGDVEMFTLLPAP